MGSVPHKVVVVDNLKDLKINAPDIRVVSAKEYLTSPDFVQGKFFRVFNLCNKYSYQSYGYYVSLLALARGHFVLPKARTVINMQNRTFLRAASEDLDELIQRRLKHLKSDKFVLSIYFGRNINKQYDDLGEELSKLFPAPLLRATFHRNSSHWYLSKLAPIAVGDIPDSHMEDVNEFANHYFHKTRHRKSSAKRASFDLAILVNDKDIAPPSNSSALKKFISLAKKEELTAELIEPKDLNIVPAYDALFIRENTNVYHHTFRFASLAEAEGIAVIDSPEAILRCNNKVFLAELLALNNILTPKTIILSRADCLEEKFVIDFPAVIKLPDSSSSLGVEKVSSWEELKLRSKELFKHSDLLLLQEYTPTDFDWRIGVLDGVPLYACKYFMARGHWQIYNWSAAKKTSREGEHETLPIEEAPKEVVSLATKAAALIGEGLFGVDLKVFKDQPMVIEVNENPNIDAGVEDQILGDELYLSILRALRRRIERRYEGSKKSLIGSL